MEALTRLKDRLTDFVWETSPERPRWQRVLADQLRLAVCVGRDLLSGQLTMRAMGLVFTSLLSLVPLIAVSFSVLKGLGVHNRVEPALQRALTPLGERAPEITAQIVSFVDNIEVGVLGTLSSIFLIFVAGSLVQQVEEAFNFTWDVRRARTLVRRFSDYVTIIVIGPVILVAATGVIASLIGTAFVQAALAIEPVGMVLRLFGGAARFLIVIFVFTLLYLVIPNTHVRVGPALVGGAVAGILWEVVGRIFATFVVSSTTYAAIYSGFAILLLFMIWLNLSWLILLAGSTLAFYRQNPAYRASGGRMGAQLAPAQRERVALAAMMVIVSDWLSGAPPPTSDQLAERVGVPTLALDRVLGSLSEAGLIVPGGHDAAGFLPGKPPGRTSAKSVLDAVR
ncbi:MAG: YhjD/YihY/BrkB family envelope integrity protein, partial [Halofilum sp. (in: g-proteobacteria)]